MDGVAWSKTGILGIPGRKELRIWTEENAVETVEEIKAETEIRMVAWVGNKAVATVDSENRWWIWDFERRKKVFEAELKRDVKQIEYSDELKWLAFLNVEGNLETWIRDFDDLPEVCEDVVYDDEDVASQFDDDLNYIVNDEESSKSDHNLIVEEDKNQKETEEKTSNDLNNKNQINEPESQNIIENNQINELQNENSEEKEDIEMQNKNEKESEDMSQDKDQNMYNEYFNNEEINNEPLLTVNPQLIIKSNLLQNKDSNEKVLCWNLIGKVSLINENNKNFIYIEFSDKSFHNNIRIEDKIKTGIATLSLNGALLASIAEEIEPDDFEANLNKNKHISHIVYVPFPSRSNLKFWEYKLQKGEDAEVITMGSNWCAVATSNHYIRVFSLEGVQTFIMAYSKPVISILGYENLLCVISHNGLPMRDSQNLKWKIIDTEDNFKDLEETELPLTPASKLKWAGFSNEGALYTYDSLGVIRQLSFGMGRNWIPVFDDRTKLKRKLNSLWFLGINNQTIIAYNNRNPEPNNTIDKNKFVEFKLSIPLLELKGTESDDTQDSAPNNEENFLRDSLDYTHQQWRKIQWTHLKSTRTSEDPNFIISNSIIGDDEANEKLKDLDCITVNSIRLAAIVKDKAKVLMLAKRLNLSKFYHITISLLNQLKLPSIAETIQTMLKEKEESDLKKKTELSLKPSDYKVEKHIDKLQFSNQHSKLTNQLVSKATCDEVILTLSHHILTLSHHILTLSHHILTLSHTLWLCPIRFDHVPYVLTMSHMFWLCLIRFDHVPYVLTFSIHLIF